ncbi:50S ribosomal protein L24 [Buchnera aphidicola (Mollitrichosiphum nigrofasciatum)]|uniref:50S ribosomal protein L24 n=1 Tax=Buchnera aphidicola TaxID=9 RepID=UPI0031B81F14
MAMKFKYNDKIIITTGKNKGQIGTINKILSNNKVIIKGLNLVFKHQKPIPSQNIPGSIFKKEAPIDISNIAILNILKKKSDRIGFRFEKKHKIRFCKSNGKKVGVK